MVINKKNLLIIIPARSGSTRVKNKNLRKIGKFPLLFYKIRSCLKANVGRVIVSTNSREIAKYSIKLGAEILFLRPKFYSKSNSSTMSAVLHALRHVRDHEKQLPKYVGVFPPTNPFLDKNSIIKSYKKLLNNNKYTSVVSYYESEEHPFNYIGINKKIFFNLFRYKGYTYLDFERTQDRPKAYVFSPALKISKISYFMNFIENKNAKFDKKTFDIKNSTGFLINKKEAFDINTLNDFKFANIIKDLK